MLWMASFTPVEGVQVACTENLQGRSGRARVEVVVGAGALHEDDDARGVAHVLEHLLLRPLGFDDNNGSTGWDYTNYYRDLKAKDVPSAGRQLIKAIASPKFGAADFEVEQRIVVRELEDRGVSMGDRLSDPIFGDSLLARFPGGSAVAVRDLELSDVKAFYDKHYTRNNVALFVRGATKCEGLKEILARELAALPEGAATTVPREMEKPRGPYPLPGSGFNAGFVWFDGDLETELTYRVVSKHLEQRALQVLRKERGLTYSPSSHFERRARGGRMWLAVSTDNQEAEVADWYDETVAALISSTNAWDDMKPARKVVRTQVEGDTVRRALAALRDEGNPIEKLDEMTMPSLKVLLNERHRMGTQVAERNIGSLLILALFGLLVLGALWYVYKSLR